MLINLIFYILSVVEAARRIIFDQLFEDSRLASMVKYEIEAMEEQLRKLTFISLILGTAFFFFGFKLVKRIMSNLVNKLVKSDRDSKRIKQTVTEQKEVSGDELSKLIHSQNFEGIDLEFKDDGQDQSLVIEKMKKL
jgi:hypothetical protein